MALPFPKSGPYYSRAEVANFIFSHGRDDVFDAIGRANCYQKQRALQTCFIEMPSYLTAQWLNKFWSIILLVVQSGSEKPGEGGRAGRGPVRGERRPGRGRGGGRGARLWKVQ